MLCVFESYHSWEWKALYKCPLALFILIDSFPMIFLNDALTFRVLLWGTNREKMHKAVLFVCFLLLSV